MARTTPKFSLKRLEKLNSELITFGHYMFQTNNEEWLDHRKEVAETMRLTMIAIDRINPQSPVYDEEFVFHQT